MTKSKVYIAGIGFSPLKGGGSSSKDGATGLVSAATKALLDAGVTYDDVTQGLRTQKLDRGSEAFNAFGEKGVDVSEAESGAELNGAFKMVQDKGAQCILVLAKEKSGTIAFVLVSEDFLWHHPYLKDSAVSISGSGKSKGELQDVCQKVWALRGWSDKTESKGKVNSHGFELSRADGKDIPKWDLVRHRQDGKHRLGHNPASDAQEIFQEDFDAVRAIGKRQNKSFQFKKRGGDKAAIEGFLQRAKL